MVAKYGPTAEQNLKLIVTLTRCLQAINRREAPLIREAGLSFAQFGVLELLYHKGPQRIADILAKNLATGGNMTVVLNNLEKRAYIKRGRHPSDRRAYLIALSKKGKKLIADLFERHIKSLNEILQGLSNKQKDLLISLSRKLGKSIN